MSIPGKKTIVIYHAGCADGITAAWCFYQSCIADEVKMYATNIRILANDKKMPDLTGADVYIVDYSYSPEELDRIASIALNVRVIDHHQHMVELLDGWDDGKLKRTYLDVAKCAAELTWEYIFNGYKKEPWFFKHIRDRDLWLWEHPDSRAFSAAFHRWGYTFKVLSNINRMSIDERADFIKFGEEILTKESSALRTLRSCAEPATFDGFVVWAINTPIFRSEIGNNLASDPDVDFAVIYRYILADKHWKISLRSSHDGIDMSKVAAKFAGGGQKRAAAFIWAGDIGEILKFGQPE